MTKKAFSGIDIPVCQISRCLVLFYSGITGSFILQIAAALFYDMVFLIVQEWD